MSAKVRRKGQIIQTLESLASAEVQRHVRNELHDWRSRARNAESQLAACLLINRQMEEEIRSYHRGFALVVVDRGAREH